MTSVTVHRSRRVPWLAILALIAGFVAGTVFGYQLRSEPDDPPAQEIERRVPTVTVTTSS